MAGGHPTEEALALNPNGFRLAASLRLGIPQLFVDWNIECECDKPANEYHPNMQVWRWSCVST